MAKSITPILQPGTFPVQIPDKARVIQSYNQFQVDDKIINTYELSFQIIAGAGAQFLAGFNPTFSLAKRSKLRRLNVFAVQYVGGVVFAGTAATARFECRIQKSLSFPNTPPLISQVPPSPFGGYNGAAAEIIIILYGDTFGGQTHWEFDGVTFLPGVEYQLLGTLLQPVALNDVVQFFFNFDVEVIKS